MAYGKGATKDLLKRMADLGRSAGSDDPAMLRSRCLEVIGRMASAGFTDHVTDPVPDGKAIDAIMLPIQSELARSIPLNVVWAEKCRMIAKSAIMEQMKRRRRSLFGKLKNLDKVGDRMRPEGSDRLVNLPDEWSDRLAPADIAALKALGAGMDFREVMAFFARLHAGDDQGLAPLHAAALRDMMDQVQDRFRCPVWNEADAVIQLHLEYRCVKGVKPALEALLRRAGAAIAAGRPIRDRFAIASHTARCAGIRIDLDLDPVVAARLHREQDAARPYGLTGLALEIGQGGATLLRGILARPKPEATDLSRITRVLSEDFGIVNTSSMVVLEANTPPDAATLAFLGSDPDKAQARAFLTAHVSGDEVRVLERAQFSGRNFLGRIVEMANRVDRLRSEIDRSYNRLDRIRAEMNRLIGAAEGALVTKAAPAGAPERYLRMHARFFRILAGTVKLKARRRAVYRSLAGLKKSWFGHVGNVRADLARKHDAIVVSEVLSYLAIELTDPAYKGRTFNRMINNGSRAQYTARADNKLEWRGITQIKVPSYHTSSTDWRHGHVDKAQRRGECFTCAADGQTHDADLHAAEMIGRYLFLRPKDTAPALAAAE